MGNWFNDNLKHCFRCDMKTPHFLLFESQDGEFTLHVCLVCNKPKPVKTLAVI